jgi:hypothetical protein
MHLRCTVPIQHQYIDEPTHPKMSRQEMAKEACTPAYAVSSPEPDGVQYLWKASRSCQWVHVSFFACRVFSAVAVLVSGW